MFGTIRKHQTWLWVVIITFTVVAFVILFSPDVDLFSVGSKENFGTVNGRPITRNELQEAKAEVYLRFFLSRGEWPGRRDAMQSLGFDENRESYYRLMLAEKVKEWNIHVDSETVAKVARDILTALERQGVSSFDVFVKQILQPNGLSAADFERFIRNEVGIQRLGAVAGLTGRLVTEQEAVAAYNRENQEMVTEAVFFSAPDYLAQVAAPPEAVGQFFTNQMARYRLPERIQVSRVSFEFTNFTAEAAEEMAATVTNLNEQVEAIYQQFGARQYADAKSPEEARERIKADIERQFAQRAARRKANDFATALFNMEPVAPGNLEKLAAERGLTVHVTGPFDRIQGPADINVPSAFAQAAFKLTPEEPLTAPFVGEDAVHVISYKARFPSEAPAFESVREKVVSDYSRMMAVQTAQRAGTEFHTALTNGLAQGKNFSAVCASAGFNPRKLPPFSLRTPALPELGEQVSFGLVQNVAADLKPGEVSRFIPTAQGGFLLHLAERRPSDAAKMAQELGDYTAYLQQMRQSEIFNEWFRKQFEAGYLVIPERMLGE